MAPTLRETDFLDSSFNESSMHDSSINGDESTGETTQSQSGHSRSSEDQRNDATDRRENLVISSAKLFVLFFLLSLAVVVSYFWYQLTKAMEEDSYRDGFNDHSTKLVEIFFERVEYKVLTASTLAMSLTSHVSHSSSMEWPFVSFPNFERRTAGARRLTGATSVWFSPLVLEESRSLWETYATDNEGVLQSNFSDPFDPHGQHAGNIAQGDNDDKMDMDMKMDMNSPYRQVDWQVGEGIYRIADNVAAPQEFGQTTYYAPIWQSAPISLTKTTAMYNQLSEDFRREVIGAMVELKTPFFSKSQLAGNDSSLVNDQTAPNVYLYHPIFDSVQKSNVVGGLTFDLDWSSFWLAAGNGVPGPLTIILENNCGQAYTYALVDSASRVEFVGEGETYFDESSEGLVRETNYADFAALFGYDVDQENVCSYRVKVYPTKDFEEEFITNRPTLSAVGVGGIFLLTAAVFIFYDCLLERRQARVMQSAKRSNAIVRSLFPAGFRDRLMVDGKKGKGGLESMLAENYLPMETSKMRLKNFLSDGPGSAAKGHDNTANMLGTEPIADFFPNTTVLYADLSGFTAWSSTREPSQVFTLLETLYGAMDKAARRLGVFKVETIGDCYVAATGIPEYRADHAVLMVRFATVCLHRITELTMTLQSALGPGTEELAMRFGIHSGPVTAGVLRGEKSRFQLFGDTMNVAARMESTGVRKKIHLSKESADLLIEAGKENWIEPREEIVTAKGKGELKTYWLKPECLSSKKGRPIQTHGPEMRQYEPATSKDSSGNDAEDQDVSTELTGIRTTVLDTHSRASSLLRSSSKNGAFGDNYKRLDRLVDWNVELLMNILKKIVARRSVVVGAKVVEKDPSQHGKIALDEIKEVIEMPEFNSQAAINMTSDSTVELPPEVRSELKAFVHRIASHYEDNPFHNFEHASHVAMSAVKLLKRIVMSDNVDYRRDSKQKETEKVKAIAKDLHQATYGISSDPVTQFSTVFSALIHDVGHTGVPNGQLAKEEPDTAERYRNKSIAEQRSVDMAWGILMEPDYENLRGAMFPTKFEMQHFRQLIVNSVLATDIFDKELSALRKARWQKAFHADELVVPIKESADDAFNRKATIVIEHIIQASDVAHTMQHWHVYQKWNERLFQEMYTAFREGRSDKDPSEGWYKGELWFFDNYVIPLAKKLNECGVFGVSSAEYLNYAVENRDEWERKGEEIVPCMVSNFESSRFA